MYAKQLMCPTSQRPQGTSAKHIIRVSLVQISGYHQCAKKAPANVDIMLSLTASEFGSG